MSRIQPIWRVPGGGRTTQPRSIEELLERVVVCPSGCWFWLGGTSKPDGKGYGRILRPGTRCMMAAHRYVYERFVGPVPLGHEVDHACRMWSPAYPEMSQLCVRPEHLEAVSPLENIRRRDLARDADRARLGLAPIGAAADRLPYQSAEDALVEAFEEMERQACR